MSRRRRPRRAPKRSSPPAPRTAPQLYPDLFALSPAMLAIGRPSGALVDVNLAYAEFFGYTREEMIGRTIADLGLIDRAELRRLLALGGGPGAAMRKVPVSMRTRTGEAREVLMSANVVEVDGERFRVATLEDVTARRHAEAEQEKLRSQLWQSQKMESIGRLAGGVAHDFNNILIAINGYASFALGSVPPGSRIAGDLREVLAAGERAAGLTRQLLAFSRRQILKPRVIDLNASIAGMTRMLKRLLGENVRFSLDLEADGCLVKVDAGQIEQVLLNLAVNARDAMPSGGTLTFQTRSGPASAEFARRHPDLGAGPVVRLVVRDTGVGMSEGVKARAFEPFFTTKEPGKGTGLGLAMVYGIVKQSGGEIDVESAPGRGTAFTLYLPQVPGDGPEADAAASDDAPGGRETILLAEDEAPVRRLAERALRAKGYTVLSAASGAEALALLEKRGGPVDALVADVLMPGMTGRELAREAARRGFVRRVLFVSGYAEDAIVHHGVLDPGIAFLGKPFTMPALLRTLRGVLDGPAERAQP